MRSRRRKVGSGNHHDRGGGDTLADSGADVVAIDADLGMANLAESVGVTPGGITLHDVLAGAADPPTRFTQVRPASASSPARRTSRRTRRPTLRAPGGRRRVRRRRLRVCGRRRGALARLHAPARLADETLLVSTAERSALGDTEKTRQLTERLGGSVAGVAITRLDPATAADDRPVDAVAETFDVPVPGRIPEDDAVLRAVEAAQPLPVFAPDARRPARIGT